MIINYSNPEATVQKLKMAIAKQLFKVEYVRNSLIFIDYQHCQQSHYPISILYDYCRKCHH